MCEVKTENARDTVTSLSDGTRELTADELHAVSGGMYVKFRIGADEWSITADAKGYGVDHTHYGP
jgi:hypothetical protein